MPQEAAHYKRRIVYIHKPFQRNFIFKFCLIALCAMLLASGLLYFISKNSMTATYRYHHLSLQETGQAILRPMIVTNLIVLAGVVAATIMVTLYVSHKIGGPLYRLGKSIESIGKGDLTIEVKLRQQDQLMEFAAGINQMTRNLQKKVLLIERAVAEMRGKRQRPEEGLEEIHKGVEKLSETVSRLFIV
jgi:nitrogen fixation/metabolism regulation signal transduction histidine kinase